MTWRAKAEPVGFTSLWSVVSSVNVKVFESEVLLGSPAVAFGDPRWSRGNQSARFRGN